MPFHFSANPGAWIYTACRAYLKWCGDSDPRPMKSLTDLIGRSSSNDTNNSDSDDGGASDSLERVAEQLGDAQDSVDAETILESARQYVDEHGNKDALVEYAERLLDDDDLWAVQAEYRRGNDLNRIRKTFLYNVDGDFGTWAAAFYGDSDDPEPGTYNYVQSKSRDMDGNLRFYKALFPEPVEEYWDSEPVLWREMPGDDTHIYVTADWATEFADFTFEDDEGNTLVRPPNNDEIDELSGASDASESGGSDGPDVPFDPSDYTVPEIRDRLGDSPADDYDVSELEGLLHHETVGKDRKTAVKAIQGALNQARDASESDDEQASLDDVATDSDDGAESPGEAAGRIVAENDIDPALLDSVKGMYKAGWSEEDIVDALA